MFSGHLPLRLPPGSWKVRSCRLNSTPTSVRLATASLRAKRNVWATRASARCSAALTPLRNRWRDRGEHADQDDDHQQLEHGEAGHARWCARPSVGADGRGVLRHRSGGRVSGHSHDSFHHQQKVSFDDVGVFILAAPLPSAPSDLSSNGVLFGPGTVYL